MLARELGRTVAELRASMAAEEFMRWGVFYGREAQMRELERLKAGG